MLLSRLTKENSVLLWKPTLNSLELTMKLGPMRIRWGTFRITRLPCSLSLQFVTIGHVGGNAANSRPQASDRRQNWCLPASDCLSYGHSSPIVRRFRLSGDSSAEYWGNSPNSSTDKGNRTIRWGTIHRAPLFYDLKLLFLVNLCIKSHVKWDYLKN